ncbi:nucleoside monophosphate kinase [Candidatus Uhrbacteria bacterium]|nr:nucleoside monophosphate kinase [Candidatus Uhrbacteria bacterium]
MAVSEMLRIVILGPQGSGKGTQAELLSFHLGLPAFTMGGMLREEVTRNGSHASEIKPYLEAGTLVPHWISIELLRKRLRAPDVVRGFICDGFPRAVEQQEAIDAIAPPTHVVVLQLSDELAVERLTGRLVSACGEVYHVKWFPPKRPGICDSCGGKLEHRTDDTPQAIRERLSIYHHETEEVIRRYEAAGLVHYIDASGTVPVVHAAILEALGLRKT